MGNEKVDTDGRVAETQREGGYRTSPALASFACPALRGCVGWPVGIWSIIIISK